uniref:Uncharacterized protein n=1 Tax=Lepeophtheirus salmonis TaxID=72036 RepID=A0A0K2UBC0_LEPSM
MSIFNIEPWRTSDVISTNVSEI